jgi:SPX domain protein involved in polyphosphate accumulation
MVKNADKLLERMKRSKSGWKRVDIDTVYEGYGFIITGKKGGGSNHDKVYHPDYPQLITFLPRHNPVGEAYISELIKKISQLKALQAQDEKAESEEIESEESQDDESE